MTFVNLPLLAGASLVVVPIVLHLIMRRKPRRFEFPALRLVQKRHDVNRRRLRLRHLILLALRIAAIALLALALARPSVKFSGSLGSREAPVAAALVFDTSPRMQYEHENRTRLEVAQEWGLELLAQFPRDSRIAVVDTREGPATFQVDRGSAKHRLERLEPLGSSRVLVGAIEKAAELLFTSELERREIYVFTDMARAGWPEQVAAPLQTRLARMPEVGIYLIDVGVDHPTNTGLGALTLSGQVLANRSPLRIRTEIEHLGKEARRSVELYLLDSDPSPLEAGGKGRTTQRRAARAVDLADGQSRSIDFDIRNLDMGTHQGYVEVVGQDGLGCDDKRYFTVEVKPPWRILLAAPEPAAEFSFFLKNVLAPVSLDRTGQSVFECEVVAVGELAGVDLEPYSAVFLVDPTPLKPATWQKLGNFVAEGHGVALFLGRKAWPVDSFNQAAAEDLLPGKLVRPARRPGEGVFLAPRNYSHPILASFRQIADSVPWRDLPVYRYWQLSEMSEGAHVIVPFSDGRPAIVERPLGKGRVLTMTTPLSDDPNRKPWNLLLVGQSWPCFILVHRTASYLVGSTDEQLNYLTGNPAVLPLDREQAFRSYLLTPLDVPDALEARLTPNLNENVLMVTTTDRAGNYRVRAGGSASGVDRGFSVNLLPEETRLKRLPESELSAVFGDTPYRVARTRRQLEGDRAVRRVGRELFGMLIFLVAIVLAAEQLIANRFYRD